MNAQVSCFDMNNKTTKLLPYDLFNSLVDTFKKKKINTLPKPKNMNKASPRLGHQVKTFRPNKQQTMNKPKLISPVMSSSVRQAQLREYQA